MHPPDLLLSNLPQLSEQLKQRTNKVRSRIVKTNYTAQFAQTASELAEFRHATVGILDGMEANALSELFLETVQFTTYDSYAPFIARFFEKPCKRSAIVGLLSPGVPDFLLESSSTSGGLPKWFSKYDCLSNIRSADSGSLMTPNPLKKHTEAFVWNLGLRDKINVEDKDCPTGTTTIYVTYGTAWLWRTLLCLDPEKDGERMGTFILDHAAPYAAGFINKWRSFLLIHVLFALGSRSLETMSMPFINTFVEMIRFLDMEFDIMVDCIANGTIPDLDGIANVRHHLELAISPDPERAAELRNLGRPSSRPNWCRHAWPNLRSVTAAASGAFASSVPLARYFLGPNTDICPVGYSSSEARIGVSYNPVVLNQFKLLSDNIFEFLDISKNDSISNLVQVWEVEQGRLYEVVLTTEEGLWRYRLKDVVEIAGFDPTDGVPIVRFVERRNVAIRLDVAMVSETELRTVILSAIPNTLVKVVDWTATIDDRQLPKTIGFFVELSESGDHTTVPDLAFATEHALDALSKSNANITHSFERELFRKPTIRLVQPGTFSDFRQSKLDEGSINVGQIKVPTVLPNAAYVAWFSDRVVREL